MSLDSQTTTNIVLIIGAIAANVILVVNALASRSRGKKNSDKLDSLGSKAATIEHQTNGHLSKLTSDYNAAIAQITVLQHTITTLTALLGKAGGAADAIVIQPAPREIRSTDK